MKTAEFRIINFKGQKVQMVLQGDYKYKNLDELEEYVVKALEFGLRCEVFKHDDDLHYQFFYM